MKNSEDSTANPEVDANSDMKMLPEIKVDMAVENQLEFGLEDTPGPLVLASISLQFIAVVVAPSLTVAIIVSDVVCSDLNDPLRARLFATTLFMSGFSTVIQALLGVRLPVFQGPSFVFLVPLLALKGSWKCDLPHGLNVTSQASRNFTEKENSEELTMEMKLQQLSGSLMAASAVEVLIGGLGLVGPLLRRCSPVAIGTVIILLGLSLLGVPLEFARPCWQISAGCLVLVIIFSLFLNNVRIPIPHLSCKKRTSPRKSVAIFQIIPLLLSMFIAWAVSAVLTKLNVFNDDPNSVEFKARTDARAEIVDVTPWLILPYPGQFGMPSFNIAVFVGFSAAIISSIMESVGDYFATASACRAPSPPDHAINRGILIEGLASVLSGSVGAAHATTSYSMTPAIIILTKTASRSAMVTSGCALMLLAVMGKFGAVVSTVPDPAVAGLLLGTLGLMFSIGVSILHNVDMKSSRNLAVVGISICIGMIVPIWMEKYPDYFETGDPQSTQIVKVIFGTPIILGGIFVFILDSIVKGSREERGFMRQDQVMATSDDEEDSSVTDDTYELPFLRKVPAIITRFCPFLSKGLNQ